VKVAVFIVSAGGNKDDVVSFQSLHMRELSFSIATAKKR
jgi:hypothetical protein